MTTEDNLRRKICAEINNGRDVLAEIAETLGEERRIVSNCLFALKAEGVVFSWYDPKIQNNRWKLSDPEAFGSVIPPPLPAAEIRARILRAVENGKHLPRAIARESGLNEGQTMIVLMELEEDNKLVRKTEVNFSAWFLPGSQPVGKIVLDGTGGVIEVPPPDGKVSAAVYAEAEKAVAARNGQLEKIKKEETMKNGSNTATGTIVEQDSRQEPPRLSGSPKNEGARAKKGISYSAKMFEDFGRRGLNKSAIARAIGAVIGSVCYQLKKKEFSAAYQRGLAEYYGAASIKNVTETAGTFTDSAVSRNLDSTENTEISAAGDSEVFGQENTEAGIEKHELIIPPSVEIDPRFSGTLQHLAAKNPLSREGIQKKIDETAQIQRVEIVADAPPTEIFVDARAAERTSRTRVEIGGGSLNVELDGVNLFEMSKDDRRRLFDLIDEIEKLAGLKTKR